MRLTNKANQIRPYLPTYITGIAAVDLCQYHHGLGDSRETHWDPVTFYDLGCVPSWDAWHPGQTAAGCHNRFRAATSTSERPLPPRGGVARSYAQHRGRISTTELASIVDASPSNVGAHLKELESDGALIPSSPTRAGRRFHYVWAEASR